MSWTNTPNLISLSRIPLAGLSLLLLKNGFNIAALMVFILLVLTDFLDGFLARRLRQISDLGKNLDHVIDKLVVVTFLSYFVFQNQFSILVLVAIAGRELLAIMVRKQSSDPSAKVFGKIKSVAQFTFIGLIIYNLEFGVVSAEYIKIISYAVALLTIFSIIPYIYTQQNK